MFPKINEIQEGIDHMRFVSPIHWPVRKRALVLTLISLFIWETWEGFRIFPHPWGDLKCGTYTDHFSHMNAARIFPAVGFDIWRCPIASMLAEVTPEKLKLMPQDIQKGGSSTGGVFAVPDWPEGKPLVTSWSNKPRIYPPGDMLMVAPVAVLYHYTGISFETANRLLLMLFLIYAHIALFLFFKMMLIPVPGNRTLERLQILTAAIVYIEVIHWTLEGFYDAFVLIPLILCSRALANRRGLSAVEAFCVASVFHFRVFFFAPWFLYGVFLIIIEAQWQRWHIREWLTLLFATVLGVVSLAVFFLLWPTLQQLPVHNPINIASSSKFHLALLPVFLLLSGIFGRVLWRSRAYLDIAILGWITFMLVMLREAYPWHIILAVVPWMCAPSSAETTDGATRVRTVRLLFLVTSICIVFSYEPFEIWKLWPL